MLKRVKLKFIVIDSESFEEEEVIVYMIVCLNVVF